MAKNWMLAEAYKEIVAGNKDAIADIGGRFPIATTALGMIGENAGASMVFGALDFVTVRKVEANLKEGVKPIEDDPKPEKEAKKAEAGDKPKGKRGRKKKGIIEKNGRKYTYDNDKADAICISLYGFLPEKKQKLELEH